MSPLLYYIRLVFRSSIFACSSTSMRTSHIACIILMVLVLLPYTCYTVHNEPRSFLLTQFSRHLHVNPPKRTCNIQTCSPRNCCCNLLFVQSTLGGALYTLVSICFTRRHSDNLFRCTMIDALKNLLPSHLSTLSNTTFAQTTPNSNAMLYIHTIDDESSGGTQNGSRRFGFNTHPSSPSKNVGSSWWVLVSGLAVSRSAACVEFDEKGMKSLSIVLSVGIAVVGCEMQLPCGEDAEESSSAWSCNDFPIAEYQTRTGPASCEKEMMRVLSREKETAWTDSVYPRKGRPIGCLVAVSHSRAVLSYEPETMRVPSGENETELTD
ncbi:uncharacterized protein BJ212DRAFT_1387767 [Suillus subaureus]|uniref:Uncharacterized protein n=1 Tax=Suillus subaureus TaxID=48587 RepID=A0A9P7DZV9_9AGAM|nr:uncharacterized protein BJ212DRAFT_1387767 [Suillus subaureus]KAG1807332.1 hypothetical protein BJ212DRAFT_1387767 [Suillus subaureus]